jgi:bifunctional non-homologous end joining protein LigD
VLDGEIVAIIDGAPARFQELQGRMHLGDAEGIAGHAQDAPAALLAFDLLLDGDDVLLSEPWTARRARLEQRLGARASARIQLGESVVGEGMAMLERARASGWEGVIAKRTDATYSPGQRAKHWLKLKIEHRQEFVIGGYTEPRNSRQHIGALLLGYFDDAGRLVYVGHTGGGFTRDGLRDMARRLAPLARKTSPFADTVRTNEPAHWVRPSVVVEVKFIEWTGDGRLRQPIFLGVRDDKPAREVGREPESVQARAAAAPTPTPTPAPTRGGPPPTTSSPARRASASPKARATKRSNVESGQGDLVGQLSAIEAGGGDGTLRLDAGVTLDVSNLGKPYFPDDGITKGGLMRYYAGVAEHVLPVIVDRPLVMRRFPNGIGGKAFYQHRADDAPAGVRTALVDADGDGDAARHLVGGDLATLLYSVQLGAISVDPWHSRAGALDVADYTVLDLDPGDDAPFSRVVQVARWVKEELDAAGLRAALKTSGASGLHIFVPMPPRTSPETALLVAQIIATRVAAAHPAEATVERGVKQRARDSVYVDYLQNIVGKTVAAAYAVRARPGATVSTPLDWAELTDTLDPTAFTIHTVPARLAELGDLWQPALRTRNTAAALRGLAG